MIGTARAIALSLGRGNDVTRTAAGAQVVIDRPGAIEEFFRDPEQSPPDYNLLVVCAWIAVAPAIALRKRARLAATAIGVIGAIEVMAFVCLALAWYQRSVMEVVGTVPSGLSSAGLLDGCGSVFGAVALFVVPTIVVGSVYPGLELPRSSAAS